MLQDVHIDCFRSRDVCIGGVRTGETDPILRFDADTHVFDLGIEKSYERESIGKRVAEMAAISPLASRLERR